MKDAGVEVELTIHGTRRALEPAVELTAYRVVQESLTNVLRHSGSGRASVAVIYRRDALDIDVRDPGELTVRRPPYAFEPSGHGLVGLGSGRGCSAVRWSTASPTRAAFASFAHLPSRSPEQS